MIEPAAFIKSLFELNFTFFYYTYKRRKSAKHILKTLIVIKKRIFKTLWTLRFYIKTKWLIKIFTLFHID